MTTQTKSLVDIAASRSMQAGRLLLSERALTNGVNDARLDRADLKVLACVVMLLRPDHKAEFSRASLCLYLGLSPKTVSNRLSKLRTLGYLVSEPVIGTHKQITAFGDEAVRLSEIEAAITQHVNAIRQDNVPSMQGTNVPSPQGTSPNEGNKRSPHTGNKSKKVPSQQGSSSDRGKEGSPHTGNPRARVKDSSISTTNTELDSAPETTGAAAKTKTKGSRLSEEWVLTRSLAIWALENFHVTESQVRAAAEKFKDYYLSAPGQKGVRADWRKAWQSWCRSDYQKWRRRDSAQNYAVEQSALNFEKVGAQSMPIVNTWDDDE